MIYTRFGSEIVIQRAYPHTIKVTVKRISNGDVFDCNVSDLKADMGIAEIEKEIRIATPTNMSDFGALI